MIDASAYDMEENIRRTKKIVDLCHVQGVAVEGELGHVGQAATMDGLDASMYTKPEEVIEFLECNSCGFFSNCVWHSSWKVSRWICTTVEF